MKLHNEELKRYIPIVNAIAQTFGKGCEVVLHDLTSPQSSVMYTANSHVTGRSVGQSFNHLITQVLLSKNFKDDVVANYPTQAADKRILKSTTALIRNEKEQVIGALCINFDLQKLMDFKDFMAEITYLEEEDDGDTWKKGEVEVLSNVWEIVDSLIERTIISSEVDQMDKHRKMEIVQFMEEKGAFLVKGALEKVAAQLKISKATIYSYLDEIRSHKNEEVI